MELALSTTTLSNQMPDKIDGYYCKATVFDRINLHFHANRCQTLLIYGYSGLGKTALANSYGHYVLRSMRNYIVHWFKMNSYDNMIVNYIEFLFHEFDLDLNILQRNNLQLNINLINENLERVRKSVLLIFDNVDNQPDMLQLLVLMLKDLPTNVKVLVTSRSNKLEFLNLFDYQLELKPFERFDASLCLKELTNNKLASNDLEELLDLFDDDLFIPLELRNIQISITKPNLSNQTLKSIVKQGLYDKVSMYLFLELFVYFQNERVLLMNLAFLKEDNIKEKLLFKLTYLTKQDFNQSLTKLENMSMIKKNATLKNKRLLDIDKALQIELRYFIRKNVTPQELEEFFNQNVSTFFNMLENESNDYANLIDLMHMQRFLDNFDECCNEFMSKSNDVLQNEARLSILIAEIYKEKYSKFTICLNYYMRALKLLQRVYSDANHLSLAYTLNKIGLVYQELKLYDKSIEYLLQSRDMMSQLYDELPNLNLSIILNNIGLTYQEANNYEKSNEYLHASLQMMRDHVFINNKEHSCIAISLNNIGTNYRFLGDYENSIKYFMESLTMKNKLKNFNNDSSASASTIANTLNNIGLIYQDMKNYNMSIEYLRKGLEIYENDPTTANKSPIVADLLNNLGVCYLNLNEYKRSIEFFMKALDIYQLAEHHVLTKAETYANIGVAYFHSFKYVESIEYLSMAHKIYEAYMASVNIGDIDGHQVKSKHRSVANTLGLSFFYLNQYDKSIAYLKKTDN